MEKRKSLERKRKEIDVKKKRKSMERIKKESNVKKEEN